MEKIKAGDIVYLKSDKKKKTRINVGHETSIRMFNCYWYTKEGHLAISELPEEILTK